jgi:hypothetical protein
VSGVVLFGLAWAAVGILLGVQWWRERAAEAAPTLVGGASVTGSERSRFGRAEEDGSPRRLQAMRLAYAAGMLSLSAGFLTGAAVPLALGAALVNLGTIYRYLVVALAHDRLDAPLIDRPGRYLVGVLDQPAT